MQSKTIVLAQWQTFAVISVVILLSISNVVAEPLEREFINPASGYTQLVAVSANGVKTLYLSGQVSEGDTTEIQLRGAFAAIQKQLADAGAKLSDIVRLNTYIVNYEPSHLATFKRVRDEFFEQTNRPASTLVGVTALALPEYLVEIEATAVLAQSKND